MKYFTIAFFTAIGWYLGKDIYKAIDVIVDSVCYEKFEWYRKAKDETRKKF